jgi:histidyl-tRNA synthetase
VTAERPNEGGIAVAKLDNGPARGTRDFLPGEVARREAVIGAIASSYGRFGFHRIETPAIESVERLTSGQGGENEKLIFKVLKRGLPDQLAAGTATDELTDLALRYDLTVPLTRFYANNQDQLGSPFRSLQIGPVWRAERPARGRFRQFTQCDIDVLGEPSVLAESELMVATLSTLCSLAIAPVTVRLNDRRLLRAVAVANGVSEQQTASYFVTLDKVDRLGWEGVAAELEKKGFAPGVAVASERLLRLLGETTTAEELVDLASDSLPGLEDQVLADLGETAGTLERLSSELPGVSYRIDPTVVRGMGYYTGQIFEIAHTESSLSIGGGGRYDGLLERSLGRPVPACGFSIGFERVVDLAEVPAPDLGIALLYDKETIASVLQAAETLRAGGSPVALYPRRKGLRNQLEGLEREGYRSFVLFEEGKLGEVRPLGPS